MRFTLFSLPLLLLLGLCLSCRSSAPRTDLNAAVQDRTALPSLAGELKQMKQAGLPTTPEALQAPLPPVDQNAAPVYRQLVAVLKTSPTTGDDKIATDGVGGRPLTPEKAEKLRLAFQRRSDIGRLIHKAAGLPKCVYDRKWAEGAAMRFPEFATMRVALRWLSAESALQLYDGKPLDAIKTQALGFHLADQSATDPMLIACLVADALDAITITGMERILYAAGDQPGVANAVRRAVETGRRKHSLSHALTGEVILPLVELEKSRRLSPDAYEKSQQDTMKEEGNYESLPPLTAEDRAHWDRFVDRSEVAILHNLQLLNAAADKPYPEAKTTFENVISGLEAHKQDAAYMDAQILFPVYIQSLEKQAQIEAKASVLRAAAALFTYKRQHGAWPETLAEAVPHVPADPFDGSSLRYKRDGDGFVVYSIGLTGKFDGGTAAAKPDAKESFFRYPAPPYRK